MQSAPSLVGSDARLERGRCEWSKRTFLAGIILTGLWTCSAQAFEIYLDTNAPASASRASELFDANKWKETAATIDGIWFAAQGMTKAPEGISLGKARDEFIKAHRDLKWICEISQSAVESRARESSNSGIYEPSHLVKGGIKDFEIMSYTSGKNYSTLTEPEIEDVRTVMGNSGLKDVPLIVNTRNFTKNDALQKLLRTDKVQGVSFEVPAELLVNGGFMESEVVPTIKLAYQQQKIFYLLLNADKSKDFVKDVEVISEKLLKACRREMGSPKFRFVLANYMNHGVAFIPERDAIGHFANTTTGAALWLAEFGQKRHLRDKQSKSK